LPAADKLPEFSAKYSVEKFGVKLAEAHYQLNHTETGYKFTQDTELYGVANIFSNESVSAFSLVENKDGRLLLTRHHYVQKGSKKNRNEDIYIEWSSDNGSLEGKITGTVRGKKINLKTGSQIWEALSFQIPLMIDAKQDVKEYPYHAILKGKIDTYNFTLTANENITFAGKQYNTLHVVRSDPRKDRQLHIWLIPELNNIPFIVENYREGKLHSSMQLESVKFDGSAPLKEETVNDDF
jgi:hypothetical protein